MHPDTNDPKSVRVSILSYLRLSIGNMEAGPPTEEEKILIEKAFEIRTKAQEAMGEPDITMVVALVAAAQVLEDVLCHYETDMPDVLTAIICKLTLHGTQHMQLQDNPKQEIKFGGTIH
mgnify:CR=1 FL=1